MCVVALNRGGLSAGLLPRDFGTTTFPGCCPLCERNAVEGHGNSGAWVVGSRRNSQKAGPQGPAFRLARLAAETWRQARDAGHRLIQPGLRAWRA